MKSMVSEKGQITIPKEIRQTHGISPGSEVQFHSENGQLILSKVVPRDPLDKWRGRAKGKGARESDAYLRLIRDANSH